ncbi:7677_t:CDS:2, partial [Gigaspora margarita]
NLFPTKFTSNKPVVYKKLSEEKLNLLDEELICQSKWKIEEIGDLLDTVNHTNVNNENYFWVKFAELGQKGSFHNKKIFEGLCQIMVQIADREQDDKGLQNLKYSDQFFDFLVILASL